MTNALLSNLLQVSNLSIEDVLAAAAAAGLGDGKSKEVPTVREFYDLVRATAEAANGEEPRGGGMFRTYEPYWRLFVEGYPYQHKRTSTVKKNEKLYTGCGDKALDKVKLSDLIEARKWVERRALLDAHWKEIRREERGRAVRDTNQAGADYNFYGAMRHFFGLAVDERHVHSEANPTEGLAKPVKPGGERRALTHSELVDVWDTVRCAGDDPELDTLMVETVLVTGARREGLINLNLGWLNHKRVSLKLSEKGDKLVEQPATSDLLVRLEAFARSRGAQRPRDPVFCQKRSLKVGRPVRITDSRFDTLHARIQKSLPWADQLGLTVHWLRHHSVTQVSRIAGEVVAARFARHAATSVTRVYDKASGSEVCAAVGMMTGTVHPLAEGGW